MEEKNVEEVMEEVEQTEETEAVDEGSVDTSKLQEENEELNNKYLRMAADFQNLKKRTEKEKSDIYNFANEKLILDLLPVVDNLERAVTTYKEEGKDEAFTEGVEMILQQFLEVFKKNGVEEIEALGKAFDPNLHHAVMQEASEEHEANIIIDIFQKGYVLNGRVIRPSMVKVSN